MGPPTTLLGSVVPCQYPQAHSGVGGDVRRYALGVYWPCFHRAGRPLRYHVPPAKLPVADHHLQRMVGGFRPEGGGSDVANVGAGSRRYHQHCTRGIRQTLACIEGCFYTVTVTNALLGWYSGVCANHRKRERRRGPRGAASCHVKWTQLHGGAVWSSS